MSKHAKPKLTASHSQGLTKLSFIKMGASSDRAHEDNSSDEELHFGLPEVKASQNLDDTQSVGLNINFEKPVLNKKFVTSQQLSNFSPNSQPPTFAIPNLLDKVLVPKKPDLLTDEASNKIQNGTLKLLPSTSFDFAASKLPSFSSIFNREHEEVSGGQRVFRKSLLFLGLSLGSLGLLAYASLKFFTGGIVFALIALVLYIVTTTIFFIVLANRNYLWLNLTGQLIIILSTQAFLGQAADKITLFVTALIILLVFLSYNELEKVQLSSRIFSLSHIAGQTIKILSTTGILIITLGIFNQIIFVKPDQYVSQAFLSKPQIVDSVLIGKSPSLSLNRVFMNGKYSLDGGLMNASVVQPGGATKENLTFRQFLIDNYRTDKVLLSDDEKNDILATCNKKSSAQICDNATTAEINSRLEIWRQEVYPNINYPLDTVLDVAKFREITKQFYINRINAISNPSNASNSELADSLSKLVFVPKNYIIPSIVALVTLVFLLLTKFLIHWAVSIFSLLVWQILKWVGFVKIEVENVEAEIVSI